MPAPKGNVARAHLDAVDAVTQALTDLDRIDYCALPEGCSDEDVERDHDPHGGRWIGCRGPIPPELAQDVQAAERALRRALATAAALYTGAMLEVDEERGDGEALPS